ncbi:hypothetical protein [Flavobacterium sp. 25HG05S-40]|uniref:hypothetical protein n=1 Tax=Flavobacterium sp. 25HG05S-40 TaxID=3458682 RepID=UPI0040446C4D
MKSLIIFITLLCSITVFSQNKDTINLIAVDSTWGKEIIEVPFWFAPKINYTGFEDIRFAKGWEDKTSDGFWVVTFAWDINLKTKPTAKFFEENVIQYYDGLMKVVNEDKTIIIPKTEALFIDDPSKNGSINFTGIIKTYDAFTTKKIINLYCRIETYYCKIKEEYIPHFKFSPKEFRDESWATLDKIKLQTNSCE